MRLGPTRAQVTPSDFRVLKIVSCRRAIYVAQMKITHPSLDWRGATPVATAYGDIYYSPDDALGEVRHNFVSHVAPMMGEREIIVIGETGFGTGLNFLVTWHDWLQRRKAGDRLIFVSTEAHPLRQEDLKRALAPFKQLVSLAEQLISVWPVGIPGPHRRFFDVGAERGKVELWVFYGDALEELKRQKFLADAWYFDGFNPSENPALWSSELLAECARLMAPGAVGGTFTVAGAVRAGLSAAGLEVERVPGFGRKRACLKIRKPGVHDCPGPRALGAHRIHGSGIAAASIRHAARQRGWPIFAPDWTGQVRAGPGHFASGNPAALANFKPTKAPNEPGNRLLSTCLAHIQPLYADLWLPGRGTQKPPKDAAQALDFAACRAAMGWSDEALYFDEEGALMSPLAGYIPPREVLAYLFGAGQSPEQDLPHDDIWALGYGSLQGAPSLEPHFRRNLGQVDVFDGKDCSQVPMPITFGGYITPMFGGQVLAGSTYERDPDWDAPDLFDPTQGATDEIVEKAAVEGFSLPLEAKESYVSARAFGKDHRPIVGQTREGAWVLTGLGSRGFLTAPLLAEILLDEMEGREAAGLPTYDFKACVHPSRFDR